MKQEKMEEKEFYLTSMCPVGILGSLNCMLYVCNIQRQAKNYAF